MLDMREPENIFDPRNYDSVRRRFDVADTSRLVLHVEALLRARARSDLLQVLELHRHNSRVPDAGSYVTLNFCGVP